jgi:hypothetical protein
MLTEFEVRRQMEEIQESDATPGAKARHLLKLRRSLRSQAKTLTATQARAEKSSDVNTIRQMERMANRAKLLSEEARSIALNVLRSGNRFGWN